MRLVLVSVSEPGADVLWGSSEERLWVRLCVLGDGTRRDVYYVKLSEIQQVLFVLLGHWCVGDVDQNMPNQIATWWYAGCGREKTE